jgi:hypothetical protein
VGATAAHVEPLTVRHPELVGTFPHHPDCPGCYHEAKLQACVRHVQGLRAARVSDEVIRATLVKGWFPDWLVDDVLTGSENHYQFDIHS